MSALSAASDIKYLIVLMGFFATFNGFCYNDFMSIPIDGGGCYDTSDGEAIRYPDCVYPIGFDPVWYISENQLTFINSCKMKISVIFGVAQMTLGIIMKAFNACYFR